MRSADDLTISDIAPERSLPVTVKPAKTWRLLFYSICHTATRYAVMRERLMYRKAKRNRMHYRLPQRSKHFPIDVHYVACLLLYSDVCLFQLGLTIRACKRFHSKRHPYTRMQNLKKAMKRFTFNFFFKSWLYVTFA